LLKSAVIARNNIELATILSEVGLTDEEKNAT